jgi:hypothetical protein
MPQMKELLTQQLSLLKIRERKVPHVSKDAQKVPGGKAIENAMQAENPSLSSMKETTVLTETSKPLNSPLKPRVTPQPAFSKKNIREETKIVTGREERPAKRQKVSN